MRTFPTLLLVCALALVAPGAVASADDDAPGARDGSRGSGSAPGGPVAPVDLSECQTSECVVGPSARTVPDRLLRAQTTTTLRKHWRVVPGVSVATWDEHGPRGPVRFRVLRLRYDKPTISLDYLSSGSVPRTATVGSMLGRYPMTVGGVNGDFFDIGDTGAPLGTGLDRQDGLFNGRREGWNNTFYIGPKGRPDVGVLPVVGSIRQKPGVQIPTVNARIVRPGTIGAYNFKWGTASGYSWTEGQRSNVRMVRVVSGKVVANRTSLPTSGPIKGTILIARGGPQANTLRSMEVGSRANLHWEVAQRPQMAITGNAFLLRDGRVIPTDDRELHPRTAVGVDRENMTIILLVVDGRQRFSRGYTMVELARRLKQLGATDGLNLDGGGSSTMLAHGQGGRMRVINSPSDGAQRLVANGLQVHYLPSRAGYGRGGHGRGPGRGGRG